MARLKKKKPYINFSLAKAFAEWRERERELWLHHTRTANVQSIRTMLAYAKFWTITAKPHTAVLLVRVSTKFHLHTQSTTCKVSWNQNDRLITKSSMDLTRDVIKLYVLDGTVELRILKLRLDSKWNEKSNCRSNSKM